MLGREKIILDLIKRSGGKITRLSLMKLAFLFSREQQVKTFYDFVPYHFGPFSFVLYHELNSLINDGLIAAPNAMELQLTDQRQPAEFLLDAKTKQKVAMFWTVYSDAKTAQLMRTVYSRYPWYTLNSKREDRRRAVRPMPVPAIYTAGYEGRQIDGFLDGLLRAGIEQFIDVRANPVSRRYGYHKTTLAALCGKVGLKYHHLPQLGIPSAWRDGLDTQADYDRLFARYSAEVLPRQSTAIHSLSKRMTIGNGILVCQEADPAQCHRTHLAEAISQQVALPVRNLAFE